MKFQFTVPGLPRPKQRPRLGKHGNVYTPFETRRYETEIWTMALGAGMRQNCLAGKILKIDIRICSGQTTQDFLHIDGDNVEKVLLDALRPAFNDAYVGDLHWRKVFGNDPFVYVQIEEDTA